MSRTIDMFIISALAMLVGVPAVAQGALPELPRVERGNSPVQELESQFDSVKEIVSNLRGQIDEATERLEVVASSDASDLEAQVKAMFDQLKGDVEMIVNETRPTSALRNALSRAREQALVFREDLQRRAPDHPNRDEYMARLEKALSEYEALGADLDQRGRAALDALFALSQQQNQIVEQIRLDQILQAQEALRDVISGLSVLAESISELEPPSFEEAVIN